MTSWDGTKVLFACCRFSPELENERDKADKANVPEDAFNPIFEMNVDASAHFRVPSGVPVYFDALEAGGLAVQTMRLDPEWPSVALRLLAGGP